MNFSSGGSVANTASALNLFGCSVRPVAKIGDDILGISLFNLLEKRLDCSSLSVAEHEPGSYTLNLSPVGIDRIFLYYPGPNASFCGRNIDPSLLSSVNLFHLGYPTYLDRLHENGGQELKSIFASAKRSGVTTSLDTSLPDPDSAAAACDWPAIYAKTLPSVDIFLPSIEEALYSVFPDQYRKLRRIHPAEELSVYASPSDFRRIGKALVSMGCAIVGIKAGINGWYLLSSDARRIKKMGRLKPRAIDQWANRELWCPAFHAGTVVSATGAGDVSIAAFLAAMFHGLDPVECLKYANCAGCLNVKTLDALSGLTDWKGLGLILPTLKPHDMPALDKENKWKWNRDEKIWMIR